jgi:hypothetical protein
VTVPYETRPLDASTWDVFAELVERSIGVYGGCWCIVHRPEHERGVTDPRTPIAAAGGGLAEAVSETTLGRQAQDRFLLSGTVELFRWPIGDGAARSRVLAGPVSGSPSDLASTRGQQGRGA